jgi:hypothetical protein
LEPRGGSLFMMVPMAMFAGVGLDLTVLPGLRGLNGGQVRETGDVHWARSLLEGKFVKIFLIILFTYTSLSAFEVASSISQQSTLTKADLDAFVWAKENTPPESRFVLVTQGLPLNDASSEWFPALTERTSVATIFGYEWLNNGRFSARVVAFQMLQACAIQGSVCLNQWTLETGRDFSYVYVRKTRGATTGQTPLNVYLSNSPEYHTVYETTGVVIFLKK